ncbi:AAA family ATPase [Lawsonibacter sp. LCP25S3_G6]|uniref:cytidylate kinase-like family protein n=1 Tax=unclassified Lawsonibacter TaxID=2617946 RepID=UPI003F94D91F
MKTRIITISREFGSGGRTVGKQTAKLLGIPCYDQEVIEKVAQESGFAKEFIKERGEYTPYGGWFAQALTGRSARGTSPQDDLWVIQRKVILELAEKPCVIVGRCADYILREEADLLKAFIYADMEKRADRIVRLYGETEEAPIKRLKDKDKRRAAYYNFYTDTQWGSVHSYHISLDSGVLGIDKCSEILASLY